MNTFTSLVKEARSTDSGAILSSEISQFMQRVNKQLSRPVQDAILLTQRYGLMDRASIEEIIKSSKSSLKNLATKYNIDKEKLEDLWKLLKDLKNNIYLLPQMMTEEERRALELGKLATNDLTIDLDTPAGRNATTKMYMPLIYKIVNMYVGKSNLSKQELMSAALMGFTEAMNKWRRDDDGQARVPFKTFAGYRVQQAILNEMNHNSHVVSGSNSNNLKKYGYSNFDAQSIDGMPRDVDGDFKQDRLAALGVEDRDPNLKNIDTDKLWAEIYDIIEKRFPQKNVNIFYRLFGLHGHKKEKTKDIAKSLGRSEGLIRNAYVNPIIKFLKSTPKTAEILATLQQAYNESLMCELIGFNQEEIMEVLINDDLYILLEELNRWSNKDILVQSLKRANPDQKIKDLLSADFEELDSVYKKDKKAIVKFLSVMYPTEGFTHASDVSILDKMVELQSAYQYHKLG